MSLTDIVLAIDAEVTRNERLMEHIERRIRASAEQQITEIRQEFANANARLQALVK